MHNYFFIRSNGKYIKVDVCEILYAEALKNYVRIVTLSKNYMVLISLRQLEKELPPKLFCRVHRSFIVSLSQISSFDPEAVYFGNKPIPISQKFKNDLFSKVKILVSETRSKPAFPGE